MAESDQTLPHLVQALEGVARWRESQEHAAQVRLEEIGDDRERLEADIEELRRQLAELDKLRLDVEADQVRLASKELRRTREAVESGVDQEAAVLAGLEERYAAALKGRDERLAALLAGDDVARLVDEYEQFRSLEPTLASLPKGYRDAVLAHNESVLRRLEPIFEAASAPLQASDLEPTAITIVASLNPDSGPPEALALILPVTFAVYEDWANRNEDLRAVLAYRVVAALGAALEQVGVPDAAVQYADYRGLLAIQVWFGESAPSGDLREALVREIERLADEASELQAVGLELYTAWLDPRVVTGAEDDEAPEDDTAPDLSAHHDADAGVEA